MLSRAEGGVGFLGASDSGGGRAGIGIAGRGLGLVDRRSGGGSWRGGEGVVGVGEGEECEEGKGESVVGADGGDRRGGMLRWAWLVEVARRALREMERGEVERRGER